MSTLDPVCAQDRCDRCDINVIPAGTGRCPKCGDHIPTDDTTDLP